jgi:hypothetical protein
VLNERLILLVYYEEMKRELNRIRIYECRCDERLRVLTTKLFIMKR